MDRLNKKDFVFNKLSLAFIILTFITSFFVFLYTDITDTMENSVLLFHSIKIGDLSHFYTYSLEHSESVFPANYQIPLYLLFMIWNLPIAFLSEMGFDYLHSLEAVLWCKLLIVIFLFVCAHFMYKIAKLYIDEKDELKFSTILILFFSAPTVILSTQIACQYDCIAFSLILAGIYEYLKENKKAFILLFCLAFPLKSFSIFVFIPLVLLMEKNVFKVGFYTVLNFVIPIICSFIFRDDTSFGFLLKAQNQSAIDLVCKVQLEFTKGVGIPLFVATYFVLCVCCYLIKYEKDNAILIGAITYILFITLAPIRSYWVFLCEPLCILLILKYKNVLKQNIILHIVGSTCGTIFYLYQHWIYNTGYLSKRLVLGLFLNESNTYKYGSFFKFVNINGLGAFMPLLFTVFAMSYLLIPLICILSFKPIRGKFICSKFFEIDIPISILLFIQSVLSFLIILILLYSETFIGKPIAIDTITPENISLCDCNLSEGNVISTSFELQEDLEISELIFLCKNLNTERKDRCRLEISIEDEDKNIVVNEIIGASSIKSKDEHLVKIDKTLLAAGRYTIYFKTLNLGDSKPIYLYFTSKEFNNVETFINGEIQDYNICLKLN